jgi:hypothetical protein
VAGIARRTRYAGLATACKRHDERADAAVSLRGDRDVSRFVTPVARAALVSARGHEAVAHDLLFRNPSTPVVAFGFYSKDRLIAWVEHSAATLKPVEVALILASLARAADRLEWLLTAKDAH